MFELRYYVDGRGRSPLLEWLDGLRDRKTRTIIKVRLGRLVRGNFGDCRMLGRGIMELRIHFGPGYRLYFSRAGETIILLLCGGEKSDQQRDIEKACTYWQEYQEKNDD